MEALVGGCELSERRREVGVTTKMLLTKAEEVSDDRACGRRITE
jgi:hypothetical protein